MAAGGHFGCSKNTFDRISGHFRSIRNFNSFEIFDKMADVGHFGCPKFTFDHISGHIRSICNFNLFWKFLTKWLPAAILDFRNSLSFFGGHIACMKITLDRISGHFRLIGHFGCPKFTFDGISGHSDPYGTLFFSFFFDKMAACGHFGCPQITFDRISGHFRSIRNFCF